jgi:arylsulfatase
MNLKIDDEHEQKHLAWFAGAACFRNVRTCVRAAAAKTHLVVMGDDIGYWNISAYNRGMMGYRTPNIDRIAIEGAILTDYYGQQSCTAGRAAFITGQSPLRTDLLKGRKGRAVGEGPDACRTAQAAGLCDGTIRQEPSR